MASQTRSHFCGLDIGDHDYFLLSEFHSDDTIDLTLCDTCSAWEVQLSRHDVTALSKKAKIELSDFLSQCVEALSKIKVHAYSFQYDVKETKDGNVIFTWKKVLKAESIKVQLASVIMEKADFSDVLKHLFKFLTGKISSDSKELHSVESKCKQLANERDAALEKLDECVSAKEKLEEDLFSKFIQVLNAKKAKLRSLRNEVEELENGSSASLRHEESDNAPGTSAQTAEGMHDDTKSSDDGGHGIDSEYDTDDEHVSSPSKKSRPKTCKALETSDSLVLGSDDDVSDMAPVKRRKHQGLTRKQGSSRPVLPKVSSTESAKKASSSNRRSSMRKSASSNKSSDDVVDPDDLFDEMA